MIIFTKRTIKKNFVDKIQSLNDNLIYLMSDSDFSLQEKENMQNNVYQRISTLKEVYANITGEDL